MSAVYSQMIQKNDREKENDRVNMVNYYHLLNMGEGLMRIFLLFLQIFCKSDFIFFNFFIFKYSKKEMIILESP